jgi:hypothetical protein
LLGFCEEDWRKLEKGLLALPAAFVECDDWVTVLVVLTVNGLARITMKTRSVGSPRDVEREKFHFVSS